jgi:hypothetical protein
VTTEIENILEEQAAEWQARQRYIPLDSIHLPPNNVRPVLWLIPIAAALIPAVVAGIMLWLPSSGSNSTNTSAATQPSKAATAKTRSPQGHLVSSFEGIPESK